MSNQNQSFTIIAGPCSVTEQNVEQIYQLAEMKTDSGKAVAGVRVVGLKSRTALNPTGAGMGMDYQAYLYNQKVMLSGGRWQDMMLPPSVELAETIQEQTNLLIATEIMNPWLQLPHYFGRIRPGGLLAWNPAVMQLGWPVMDMVYWLNKIGGHLGLKNGKWIGDRADVCDQPDYQAVTPLEKTWAGLAAYAQGLNAGSVVLIHRGVDVPEKGDYRNLPLHHLSARVKQQANTSLWFDPSHTYGPKLADSIPQAIIAAAEMKDKQGDYLYDGVLVEVGDSPTDTDQHISVAQLQQVADTISQFRPLTQPHSWYNGKTKSVPVTGQINQLTR